MGEAQKLGMLGGEERGFLRKFQDLTERESLSAVLTQNLGKNFVQRILNVENSPVLKNKDGSFSTHSMAWGEKGDKFIVFPTVVPKEGGELQRLPSKKAFKHTQETGDFIEFDTAEDAAWFSKNYKKIWEQ